MRAIIGAVVGVVVAAVLLAVITCAVGALVVGAQAVVSFAVANEAYAFALSGGAIVALVPCALIGATTTKL